jgi:hypothetical protein
VLTGLLDRSALYGVLAEIEGLGLDVLEVCQLPRTANHQDQVTPLVDRIAGEVGPPDVLVNTIGAFRPGDALTTTPETLRLMIDVNLGPALWLSQAVAPHMQRQASIAVADRIRQDVDSGLASGQVLGTPTLFIDGVVHRAGYDPPTLLAALAPVNRSARMPWPSGGGTVPATS